MNRVCLIARIAQDIELRDAGGTPVVNLRVAWNTRRKVDGEWTEVGNFMGVTVFGKQAESVAQHLEKGREIGIDGRLEMREFETDAGKRQVHEIIADNIRFIGGKGESGSAGVVSGSGGSDNEDFPFAPTFA